jgi:hypothetical protein
VRGEGCRRGGGEDAPVAVLAQEVEERVAELVEDEADVAAVYEVAAQADAVPGRRQRSAGRRRRSDAPLAGLVGSVDGLQDLDLWAAGFG